MNIVGLDSLVFGVDDIAVCATYLEDYGLSKVEQSATAARFEAIDGTGVEIRLASDAALPPANAPAPNLRETVYGVGDEATLAAIASELSKDRDVIERDGVIHTFDDSGFAIAFQRTVRRKIELPPYRVNVPGQADGRPVNQIGADPAARPRPQTLSHVVYFVPDHEKAERFYAERLGFRTTDRFIGMGPFMRPQGTLDHHCLFLIQSFNSHMVGLNHFTFHMAGASEVWQAGYQFEQKGYRTFWGPGRHLFGSNHFWYFNSPFGGAIEYDADMDRHDDSWQPREAPANADTSQIFLFQARELWAPGP